MLFRSNTYPELIYNLLNILQKSSSFGFNVFWYAEAKEAIEQKQERHSVVSNQIE